MNDFLKDYLKELDTNTANAMSTELIPNRELAFTHYILTQIAAKVGAENFEVIHADIKDSAGKYLGGVYEQHGVEYAGTAPAETREHLPGSDE